MNGQNKSWIISDEAQLIDTIGLLDSARRPLNLRQVAIGDEEVLVDQVNSTDIVVFHCGDHGLNVNQISACVDLLSGLISASRMIVIDDEHSSERGVTLLLKGLTVYLARPLNLNQLEMRLELLRLQKNTISETKSAELRNRLKAPKPASKVLSSVGTDYLAEGGGEEFERMIRSVKKVAKFDTTILLGGETGTGKSHLARIIHQTSDRNGMPFITINCAAISPTLFESELFGHAKGAFTGADSDRIGKLTEAASGTIFLDEIDSLPVALQAKLLRVFEEKVYEPVGSNQSLPMKARLIVASNRDLSVEVNEGRFRSDLYYRLNVVAFEIPPLRARKSLISQLIERFLNESAGRLGVPVPMCTPETLDMMQQYDWPGNIRELRNVIERAVTLCDANLVTTHELTPELQRMKRSSLFNDSPETIQPVRESQVVSESGVDSRPKLSNVVENQERETILESVRRNGFNLLRTSKDLGISRMTLYKKLDKYEIRRETLHCAG